MNFTFKRMTETDAWAIMRWQYGPPYDLYNATPEDIPEGVQELLKPEHAYHTAFDEQARLVGYCCFGPDAQVPGGDYTGEALDIGLGLRPDLTGQGLGLPFLQAILVFARREFAPSAFRLTVATFNERAVHLYEKAGFQPTLIFMSQTKPNAHEFMQMERNR
jgi:RimJ/RimL family protein N-acetyltransferase